MNCVKIGLPGKLIIGDYFQENRTSRIPFLLLRISFPGRPIFIQFVPGFSSRVGEVEKSLTSNSVMANETLLALGVDRMTETRCSCVSEKLPRIQNVREIFLYLEVGFISKRADHILVQVRQ